MQYKPDWLTFNEDGLLMSVSVDLYLDELQYAFLTAKISFFQQVQSDVNNIVGYTTDALTVTNADKPFQNLQQSIATLEQERRKVYYSMVRHVYM